MKTVWEMDTEGGEGIEEGGEVESGQNESVSGMVAAEEISEVSVAQLSSKNTNVSGVVAPDECVSVSGVVAAEEISEVSVAQLSSKNMNMSGVVAADECMTSVTLLSKSSMCVEPSSRKSDVQTSSTQKSQDVANTKTSLIANLKRGKEGVVGTAGSSKGRGEKSDKQTDSFKSFISFKKPENIHPRIAKYHKIFEGNREKSKGLHSIINSSPLKRKLHFPKNSYLVEVFKEDTHSNPQEESEIIASPAKRTKYCRSGGGGTY